jgi:ribonuclease HI
MTEIIACYSDGGVIATNPSPIGGSWAWCHIGAGDVVVAQASGILPAAPGAPVSNNVAELTAALRALAALPPGWAGPFYSDSQVTIGRIFWGWAWRGLPASWIGRKDAILARLGPITPVLLQGHPTQADLARGIGAKRGYPVSRHNVMCDRLCTEAGRAYLSKIDPKLVRPKA